MPWRGAFKRSLNKPNETLESGLALTYRLSSKVDRKKQNPKNNSRVWAYGIRLGVRSEVFIIAARLLRSDASRQRHGLLPCLILPSSLFPSSPFPASLRLNGRQSTLLKQPFTC